MEYKVLIIDDDPMMLFLHKNLIVKSGIDLEPQTFLNGLEALEYLRFSSKEDCSYTLLLDLHMPVMNGWQVLEELMESSPVPSIDVAVVTSSISKKDREKAFEYPMVRCFLTKPFYNLEEIRAIKERRQVLE